MKRFYFTILYTLFLISLIGCQTVSKKIEDTTTKEEQELSKWLNKPEEDLKSFYGQPDKVEFLKTRNRNYVYITVKILTKSLISPLIQPIVNISVYNFSL